MVRLTLSHTAIVRGTPATVGGAKMARKKSRLITHGRQLNDLGLAFVESVYEAGGNDEDARRIFKNDLLRKQLGRLVMGKLKFEVFPIWKTIRLGTGLKTAEDFLTALKRGGYGIQSDWMKGVLSGPSFTIASEKVKIKLVKVTVSELGFLKGGVKISGIYQRAQELGLGLCSLETALQLRLQYKDQPVDDVFSVATKTFMGPQGSPDTFYLTSAGNGILYLLSGDGHPEHLWSAAASWVFVANY